MRFPIRASSQAVLITGAAAGVYDGFDWIAPLEDFVRAAYANKIPMVGVCFGHQLMAQVLGGSVREVRKGLGHRPACLHVAPGNGVVDGEADRDCRLAPGPGDRAAE